MGSLAESTASCPETMSWEEAAWEAWCLESEAGKDECCRRVWPVLFRYAKSFGVTPEEAEDVVQDLVLSVLINGFPEWVSSGRHVAAYLFTAVRNRALNVVQRNRNHESIDGSQASDGDDVGKAWTQPIDQSPQPEHLADQSEASDVLDLLLEDLPVDERTVIKLRVFERLTFQKIADLLERPLGTVNAQYRRAIEKLGEGLRRRRFGE